MEAHTDHSPAASLSVRLEKIGKKEEKKRGNTCLNKIVCLDINSFIALSVGPYADNCKLSTTTKI